jgi:Tfp pilus assembly protein PilF
LNKKDLEKARKDFKAAIQADPGNKAAQKQLAVVEKKIQEQVQKEKKMYGKMFG